MYICNHEDKNNTADQKFKCVSQGNDFKIKEHLNIQTEMAHCTPEKTDMG